MEKPASSVCVCVWRGEDMCERSNAWKRKREKKKHEHGESGHRTTLNEFSRSCTSSIGSKILIRKSQFFLSAFKFNFFPFQFDVIFTKNNFLLIAITDKMTWCVWVCKIYIYTKTKYAKIIKRKKFRNKEKKKKSAPKKRNNNPNSKW